MSNSKEKRADALFEIGCEELPPGYFQSENFEELPGRIDGCLVAYRLKEAKDINRKFEVLGTPRRIVFKILDLVTQQPATTKELFGPKKLIAYNAAGSLTKAGLGFIRKAGVTPEEVQIKDEKLFVLKEEPGKPTIDLLPKMFMHLYERIQFTKTMRWEATNTRFARPIRWIVALFGDKVVDLEIAGVRSGRVTCLHPLNEPNQIEVKNLNDYEAKVQAGKVVLSSRNRGERIRTLLDNAAKELQGQRLLDGDSQLLVQQVSNLVEYPQILVGKIDEKFMSLPSEVLVTAMREHQQYFAIHDSKNDLMPYFLTVYDNPLSDGTAMKSGFENVLVARLQDAQFFYAEDVKHSLAERVPELDRVRWVRGLGSLLDKTKRLEFLGVWFAQALDPAARQDTVAAARLAKTDLITNMVQEKEFTSLQGIMGSIYAQAQGLPESVVKAMAEQYLPRWAGDKLPETPTGRLLSLADKFDHIIGCWGAGFAPTGAKDPYALRRAVQGVIAITLDAGYRYSLPAVLEQCLSQFETLREKADTIISEVIGFIQGRMETELANREIAPDLSQAVLGVWWNDISAVVQKAEAIHQLRSNQGFNASIVTFSRVVNILPKGTPRQVAPEEQDLPMRQDLLTQPAEKELYAAYQEIGQTIADLSQKGDFITSFKTLGQLKTSVDQFFDDVLVMDKNEEIRENRLNLLTNLARKIWSLADFSKLVVSE
ncbi:glycine--tRNA ligase subunit beta [bacterium]|nr:glycine--tRNA ligase subunit beta [bacterium]